MLYYNILKYIKMFKLYRIYWERGGGRYSSLKNFFFFSFDKTEYLQSVIFIYNTISKFDKI